MSLEQANLCQVMVISKRRKLIPEAHCIKYWHLQRWFLWEWQSLGIYQEYYVPSVPWNTGGHSSQEQLFICLSTEGNSTVKIAMKHILDSPEITWFAGALWYITEAVRLFRCGTRMDCCSGYSHADAKYSMRAALRPIPAAPISLAYHKMMDRFSRTLWRRWSLLIISWAHERHSVSY